MKQIYKDQNGSAIGVVAHRAGTDILFISSYLPASLNRCGFPQVWNEEDPNYPIQAEARSTYASLFEWTQNHKYWVLGGDLNETRSTLDRKSQSERKIKSLRKFVDVFLEKSKAVDLWRHLYPINRFYVQKRERVFLSD